MEAAIRADARNSALDEAAEACKNMADHMQKQIVKIKAEGGKCEHLEGRMLGWSNASDEIRELKTKATGKDT